MLVLENVEIGEQVERKQEARLGRTGSVVLENVEIGVWGRTDVNACRSRSTIGLASPQMAGRSYMPGFANPGLGRWGG